ncbi:MAG: InlB B-repeat-containing protein, partial [Clostridia bacterium]
MEKKNHGLKITLVVLMCAIIVIGCAGLIFGALIKKPHEIFISFKDTNGAIFKEEKLDEKEVKKENSTSENAVLDYAPTKDGYVFKGWFVDTELTHQFDKNDLVVGSLILYA